MGFARQGLWVMGYCGLMGYGLQIPTHQLGGPKWVWDFRGYGLSGAWVKRVSTVFKFRISSGMGSFGVQSLCLTQRRSASDKLWKLLAN